jgi:hypothetical protein
MTVAIETNIATGSDKISSTTCNMWVKPGGLTMGPTYQGRDDNPTSSTGGTAVIGGQNCMMVDGDLIITANWNGTGLRVFRIADNGTISLLDSDATGHTYCNSMAIDTVRGKAYTGRYTADGIQEFDYSDFQGGGAGAITAGTLHTVANSDLQDNRHGYAYFNGLYMCGDWIYICRYSDAGAGTNVERWNPETDTAESVAVTRGSGTIYNGGFTYAADTNILYQAGISGGGGIYAITDPEAAAGVVKAWRINTAQSGNPSNNYPDMVQDSTTTDHLTVWGHGYRIIKLDIGTCLEAEGSSTPSVVWQSATTSSRIYDFGYGYHGLQAVGSGDIDAIWIRSDRDWFQTGGWINQSNGEIVGGGVYPSYGGFVTGDPIYSSYGGCWKKITSDGGSPTTYWVYAGYGADGAAIHSFPSTTGPRLNTSWEVVFGTWTMSGTPNVKSAILNVPGYTTPSGCTISFYLSNDNGANYQSVSPGVLTDFATTGTQVRAKIAGTGTVNQSSYVKGDDITVTLCDQVVSYTRDKVVSYTRDRATTLRLAGPS